MKPHPLGTTALLLLILFVATSCSPKPTPEQSEKLIRAADAEISGLGRRIAETHGLKALLELYRLTGLQLPVNEQRTTFLYHLSDSTGTAEQTVLKFDTASDGHLRITFPYAFRNDSLATFELFDYQTQSSLLLEDFPVAIVCSIRTESGSTLLQINHKAKVKHQLPAWYNLYVKTGGFEIRSTMKTNFRKKNSTMRLNVEIEENNHEKLSTRIHSMVELDKEGHIRFGRKNITFKVYPIQVDFRGKNGFHTYNASHFISDFNADNHITLFDQQSRLIAKVKLVEKPGKDYVNPVVVFDNETEIEVEALMKSIRQLLSLKLRNL